MLDCSRWTSVLTEATVAKPGTSDSKLKAAHITRTRKAHEITRLALFILQKEVYEWFDSALLKVFFELWQNNMASKSPMFQFWNLILQSEMKVLLLICSMHESAYM